MTQALNIGFTGTRLGMTNAQKRVLREELVSKNSGSSFRHGDCVGADAEAHGIAYQLGYYIIMHPPTDRSLRAFCSANLILPAAYYLERNKHIVEQSGEMIACPKGMCEELRSGTWSTIRYARKLHKPYLIIYPDGTTERRIL